MNRVFKTFEAKIARRLLLWAALLLLIMIALTYYTIRSIRLRHKHRRRKESVS